MDVDGKINQANGRLKAARVRVRIERDGARLRLRATLPAKPGSDRPPHQQRIYPGFGAHPKGVQQAEAEARKISALVECDDFDWQPYLSPAQREPETCGEWVERFTDGFRGTVSATTWGTEYERVLNRLPSLEPLTYQVLIKCIEQTEANTRQRVRFVTTLTKLAKFAGLDADFSGLKGSYSSGAIDPKELPKDEAIAHIHAQISDPGWRWVFGMLSTFGLRNHEVFFLDCSELLAGRYWVRVTEGKTGPHDVWACYPEWVNSMRLCDVALPNVSGKTHADYGHRVSQFFRRAGIPFTPLDLRHRWAIRTLEFGLPIELAARQMGHSVDVHNKTYHRSINADVHQRVYDLLMQRPDRPRPPAISQDRADTRL